MKTKLLLGISAFFFLINTSIHAQELWGMTQIGGDNNLGVIFKYNLISNTHTNLFSFDGSQSGSYPFGSLLKASDGNLYGMNSSGGS